MRLIILFTLVIANSTLFSQSFQLITKVEKGWLKYQIPANLIDVTPYGEHFTPHFTRFDFESKNKSILIYVLINNSITYPYNLKESFMSNLNSTNVKVVNYKKLLSNKYYVSGLLHNNRVFYTFAHKKSNYGYTYYIEYDNIHKKMFDILLPKIIDSFNPLY
jgi:hypothetical protein